MTHDPTRRQFLRRSAHTTALAAAVSALGGVHAFAGEKPRTVRLAIIGCGGIMTQHVKGLVERHEDVDLAWLCDVDPRQIEKMAGHITPHQSTRPKRTGRYEEIVADKNVDACIIATPHHWHAPIAWP